MAATVHLGFSYHYLKIFVFNVGRFEFRPRGDPIEIPSICIYIYVTGGIIKWDFCGTDKEGLSRIFGCIAGGGIEG